MLDLNYNYIFFNPTDYTKMKDPDGYYTICVDDLEKVDGIEVVYCPLDYANKFVRMLFLIHHSIKINRIINIPFKKMWYPFYFQNRYSNDKPLCFIHSGYYVTLDYLKYLKRKYPTARHVKIYRDLTKIFYQTLPEFTPDITNRMFDLQLTFDKNEAEKYGMTHFNEFESMIDIQPIEEKYALFFAGKVKDRLEKLMDVYHRLTDAGLKCNYYLTEVPKKQRITYTGIEYGDKPLSYKQILERTVAAKCVLDIVQEGAVGYTSRFLEAVMYSKKLLTNNLSIKESPFYDERHIFCFRKAVEIDPMFLCTDTENIDYGYNDEFSPKSLIKLIDQELEKKFGNEDIRRQGNERHSKRSVKINFGGNNIE